MTSHRTTFWTAAVSGPAWRRRRAAASKTPPRTKTPLAPAAAPAPPGDAPGAEAGTEQAFSAGTRGPGTQGRDADGPPGAPPEVSSAVETNELIGGLWILQRFQGNMGRAFQGMDLRYDTLKKKYVGVGSTRMATFLYRGTTTPSNTLR